MRATLTDDDLLNWRATDGTWLAFAVINPKVILKIPTAINPIETGSVMLYPREQDGLNGCMQPLSFAK